MHPVRGLYDDGLVTSEMVGEQIRRRGHYDTFRKNCIAYAENLVGHSCFCSSETTWYVNGMLVFPM